MPFIAPVGVASAGAVYVNDLAHGRVLKYSPTGKLLEQWGVFGSIANIIASPQSLTVDSHDHLYFTDADAERIQERAIDGRVLAIFGHRGFLGARQSRLGQLIFPRDLAADDRGRVFVADKTNNRLQVFSATRALGFFPRRGIFHDPYGVAIDHHGHVYVSDAKNRVIKLSPAGRVMAIWGRKGDRRGQFNAPDSLAIDVHDNVYVADQNNNRVQEFSPSGRVKAIYESKLDPLNQPSGVAVDQAGNVYVADTSNDRIVEFKPTAPKHIAARWGQTGIGRDQYVHPLDVAVDSHGNMYVTDWYNYRVVKRAPDGHVVAIWQ